MAENRPMVRAPGYRECDLVRVMREDVDPMRRSLREQEHGAPPTRRDADGIGRFTKPMLMELRRRAAGGGR